MRRKNDELLFLVDKTKKEGDFNINLLKNEHLAEVNRARDHHGRLEHEKNILKAEIQKMKAFYEEKIR